MRALVAATEALPSEIITPLLVQTFSLCLRELRRSARTDAEWQTFSTQTRLLDRIAGVNRSYTGDMIADCTGQHALIAASNLNGMVMQLMDLPLDERNAFLDGFDADAAAEESVTG